MAIPSKYDLMLPLLSRASRGEVSLQEATRQLSDDFELTAGEREERLPKGGRRRFDDRVGWARVYLRQAGLVDLPGRGRIKITEQGRQLLETRPGRIDQSVLLRYPSFVAFMERSNSRNLYAAATIGLVTVPEAPDEPSTPGEDAEATLHTQIQYLLLQLGSDMGLGVWAARNDRNRSWNGRRYSELPNIQAELPLQFDPATTRTIELIDVLWLRGRAIVAAFEIESTTSIYSGLLRMSDLVAMQPNLNIKLYLVAPPERRDRVIQEINRPTFSRLAPALNEICRFIATDQLKRVLARAAELTRHLNPEFLDDFAEACQLPED